MSNQHINLVFEDDLSGAMLRRLLSEIRPDCQIALFYPTGGKGNIKRKLRGFNNAARGMSYLILVDLDAEYECPPTLLRDWFNYDKHPNLHFRIAVKEVESWLLASRSAFSSYLGVSINEIPEISDQIQCPKELLLKIASKSRKKSVRDDIVPPIRSTARVGPNYNARLIEFINQRWDYREAIRFSESLGRTLEYLKKM